jgi:hypothetical protein
MRRQSTQVRRIKRAAKSEGWPLKAYMRRIVHAASVKAVRVDVETGAILGPAFDLNLTLVARRWLASK